MSKPRAGWLAWMTCVALTLAGASCSKHSEGPGTGGSGEPEPLGQARGEVNGKEVVLEVLSVSVEGSGAEAVRTSFVTRESVTVRGRVLNGKELEGQIQWTLQPVKPQTADANPTTQTGPEAVFHAFSRVGTAGSRTPNPPLEYELVASLPQANGQALQVRLPPTTLLHQDEEDVLRQEYIDYGTAFQPARTSVSVPSRSTFNTGNYGVIAEEEPGGLGHLLDQLNERVHALLNNDVQEKPVGTRGLTPTTVVVSPGAPILTVGALGDTDPQGDDVCAGPLVETRCAGPILAGPNGIADTRANNRDAPVDLTPVVASAFRNPQRNRAAGSATINSFHTRGRALDIDPRLMTVPGKTSAQLMCVIEAAGDAIVGQTNSFTEHGATTFLSCDSPAADHVHVQR